MNKKAFVVLGLALVFGVITAFSVNRLVRRQATGTSQEVRKVVVAVATIATGTQIRPDQVKVEEWPKSIMPEGTFDDVAKVVNRVTVGEITIGEPILSARLAAEGSSAGLSAMIPSGQRAMTVKVDEVIGVAGFITPGTYVDIVTTVTQTGMESESTSRIILQSVKVLASGKRIEHRQDGEATEVNTVTLQVTPDQAEVLALASNAGKLQLVMRNTVDQDQIQTAGVDTPALFGGDFIRRGRIGVGAAQAEPRPAKQQASKPAPPPPPQAVVEVIRGSERATVTFSK